MTNEERKQLIERARVIIETGDLSGEAVHVFSSIVDELEQLISEQTLSENA